VTCTASHTVVLADLNAGSVVNTATASADGTDSNSDQVTVTAVQLPALTAMKSSPTTSLPAPATVTYSYLVTNTGNVSLTDVALSDDNDNDDLSCPAATLAPAGAMTCTATHTFTLAELTANGSPTPGSGVLFNTVTATSAQGATATATLSIPIIQPILETAFAYGGDGVATCFTGEIPEGDLDANRWGWTNKVQPNTTASFELYAGAGQCDLSKGTLVGTVTVVHNGSTVTVTYEMNDGFTLDETHVYVGSAPLPTGRRGDTVAPGKYPYGHDLTNASSDMYEIDANGNVYVIAHAVVVIPAS